MADIAEKTFPLADVLGVVTGRLLGNISGIYEVCQFMSGTPVWTHQLPRVCAEAAPVVLRQHPALEAAIGESEAVTQDNWQDALAGWIDRFGATVALRPMESDEHEIIDPISELAEQIHPKNILMVEAGAK